MNTIKERRLVKLAMLARHPFYSRLCVRLTSPEFEQVVEFVEDWGDLGPGEWERKVSRYCLDVRVKPAHLGEMCDLLLACKTPEE